MPRTSTSILSPARTWRRGVLLVALALVGGIAGLSWRFTARLDDGPSSWATTAATAPARPALRPDEPPGWPEGRLEGRGAKVLLLATLKAVDLRLDKVDGYTAVFRKQERLKGTLGPEQTLEMKVRHRPFAVYFKFLAPSPGKEVVYAEGLHDNKMIAHSTGVARWLVPRVAVPPDHPIALADTRHAVTEAGLANLTERLIGFRELDLDDHEAATVLDRTRDADGRDWLRSTHVHSRRTPGRPFARVEVLYDPETRFPMQISNYDWPAPGHPDDLLLAERYVYQELDLGAALSPLDFDPANPDYAFHRY